MHTYNEKEQVGQKDIQNVQFWGEKRCSFFNVEAKAYTERDKDRSDIKWNKRSGILSASPNQASDLCEGLRTCLFLQSNSKGKLLQMWSKGQAPSYVGSQTCQCHPHGSGCRVTKDKRGKGLWSLLPRLRTTPEARHVTS